MIVTLTPLTSAVNIDVLNKVWMTKNLPGSILNKSISRDVEIRHTNRLQINCKRNNQWKHIPGTPPMYRGLLPLVIVFLPFFTFTGVWLPTCKITEESTFETIILCHLLSHNVAPLAGCQAASMIPSPFSTLTTTSAKIRYWTISWHDTISELQDAILSALFSSTCTFGPLAN